VSPGVEVRLIRAAITRRLDDDGLDDGGLGDAGSDAGDSLPGEDAPDQDPGPGSERG
jgi:hypothetical protein